jgi:hypothetical protein
MPSALVAAFVQLSLISVDEALVARRVVGAAGGIGVTAGGRIVAWRSAQAPASAASNAAATHSNRGLCDTRVRRDVGFMSCPLCDSRDPPRHATKQRPQSRGRRNGRSALMARSSRPNAPEFSCGVQPSMRNDACVNAISPGAQSNGFRSSVAPPATTPRYAAPRRGVRHSIERRRPVPAHSRR